MTRIFDALQKASRTLRPATVPATAPEPPFPAPAPAVPARTPAAVGPMPRVVSVPVTPLDDQTMRELTTLRIGLESSLEDKLPRVVCFTAAQEGEGTSTVAADFAMALAADVRQRVLLIDLNARRPVLEARLIPAAEGPTTPFRGGSGDGALQLVPVEPEHRERSFVPPARVESVLHGIGPRADWVVLDGPPVLEAPEASELASLADGVVLVVQAGVAKRPVIARASELLRKSGARVIGSVLNRRRHEIPEFLYRRI